MPNGNLKNNGTILHKKKLQDKIDRLSIEEFGGVEYVKYENVRDLIGIV